MNNKRIGDNVITPTYVSGQKVYHTDFNKIIDVFKEGINANFEDIKAFENGDYDGATFTPNVDDIGNISWTNDKNLENPPTKNIRGPQGTIGPKGEQGTIFTPNVDVEGNISWKNDGGLSNPKTVNIKGPQGEQGIQGIQGIQGEKGTTGDRGAKGTTFIPSVNTNGDISWVNDDGLENPKTRNIKGPQGDKGIQGIQGKQGIQGPKGTTFKPSVDESGNLSWTNEDGLVNPATRNIKGPKGDKGDTGPQGPKGEGVGQKYGTDGGEIFNNYPDNAFGYPPNEADGIYAHAEGGMTTASGSYSHAEGAMTMASGFAAHAEGLGTKTYVDQSHIGGQYGTITAEANPTTLFAVANGNSETDENIGLEFKGLKGAGELYVEGKKVLVDGDVSIISLVGTHEAPISVDSFTGPGLYRIKGVSYFPFDDANPDNIALEFKSYDDALVVINSNRVYSETSNTTILSGTIYGGFGDTGYPGVYNANIETFRSIYEKIGDDFRNYKYLELEHKEIYDILDDNDVFGMVEATVKQFGVGQKTREGGEIFNVYPGNVDREPPNEATGEYAHAEGFHTTASGIGSHAEGFQTAASGLVTHSGGYLTSTDVNLSTIIGAGGTLSKATNPKAKFAIANGAIDPNSMELIKENIGLLFEGEDGAGTLYVEGKKVAVETAIKELTTTSFELENNTIYKANDISNIIITLPSTVADGFISEIQFTSITPTAFTAPQTILWYGDDIVDGAFVPAKNKRYDIMFYSDGVKIRAIAQGGSNV